MAKINCYFGTMGSGKSLDLIRTVYNYKERGMDVLVYKPNIDTRDGQDECVITTRVGMTTKAKWLTKEDNTFKKIEADYWDAEWRPSAIIVDECQFLSEDQVNDIQSLCYTYGVPIIFYGLKVDFTGRLFEGSKRILEIADRVVELKGICHCGRIARQNARVIDGKMQLEGDIVSIGGNELYVALCNECFREGRVE